MTTWTCPFCNQNATLTDPNVSIEFHKFNNDNRYGDKLVGTTIAVCPNEDCKEYSLRVSLHETYFSFGKWQTGSIVTSWQLVPSSIAKVFPDYIPKAILGDYNEACLIRDLSPKASATLSRRCLQGIIRDFWKVNKPKLYDEISTRTILCWAIFLAKSLILNAWHSQDSLI